ncbi:hypothetical protein DVH24_003665 [Malus domestica]|uniref:Uncharacterized protein n=1 Tax=Malus domestica TaxID=3750 RepID=A0A498IM54_MALDO|nr:hypothetical protein DVH24_003665 [Malus domestica]
MLALEKLPDMKAVQGGYLQFELTSFCSVPRLCKLKCTCATLGTRIAREKLADIFCWTKSFKTIDASVRVVAIASAGFKLSRTKLVDLIRYSLSTYAELSLEL